MTGPTRQEQAGKTKESSAGTLCESERDRTGGNTRAQMRERNAVQGSLTCKQQGNQRLEGGATRGRVKTCHAILHLVILMLNPTLIWYEVKMATQIYLVVRLWWKKMYSPK